jgi:hypothetical protein
MSIEDELERITSREGLCKTIRDLPADAEVVVMAKYHDIEIDSEIMEVQMLNGTTLPSAHWMAAHLQNGIMNGLFDEDEDCTCE